MAKPLLPAEMNICLTAKHLPTVGKAADNSFLWQIAKGLKSKGHQVTVLTNDSNLMVAEAEQEGVHVHFLGFGESHKSTFNYADAVRNKFSQLHSQKQFHILHSMDDSAKIIARFRDKYKLAVAFDVEATKMSQLFAILGGAQETLSSVLYSLTALVYKFARTYFSFDRKLLNSADGVFVSSPQQRIVLERYYLYPDARTYTVSYGVGELDVEIHPKSIEHLTKLGLFEDTPIVMSVSDMTEVSDAKSLFLAFRQLVLKKPEARLILIGNGPKKKEIEYEMYNLALGNKVILTGAITTAELPNYMSLADVFVNISSRTSGFDSSVLQAMAQKKVVIGSEVGALSSLINATPEEQDGFLVRPADHQDLAALLLSLFDGGTPTAEIGDRARRKVLNFFDKEKMVNETVRAYFSILKQTGYYRRR